MKTPTLLSECICKNDALYLKNFIEQIVSIHIEIVGTHKNICLIVDECNYAKAHIIVENQKHFLPSALAKKHEEKMHSLLEEKEQEVRPKHHFFVYNTSSRFATICKYLIYLSIPAIS